MDPLVDTRQNGTIVAMGIVISALLTFIVFLLITKPVYRDAVPTSHSTSTQTETTDVDLADEGIVEAYKNSDFKVVDMILNPFYDETRMYALYVVAERGVNDGSCGGMYGPKTCYFFLESDESGIPGIVYVGKWAGGFPSYVSGDIVDAYTFEFEALGVDAGSSVRQLWQIDLASGRSTKLEETVSD